MSTIAPETRHPALDVDESERIGHRAVVASMAAAGHAVSPEELERPRGMCDALAISGPGTERVLEAARQPDRVLLGDQVHP